MLLAVTVAVGESGVGEMTVAKFRRGLEVATAVCVTVTVGAATVVVAKVTPMHEQALEYRTLPEQGDA
jgi:hypothetical protein